MHRVATCYLTIGEAAKLLRRRELSPTELTRSFLERIEALDGQLHAFITVTAEQALAQAQDAERALLGGEDRGPLQGIPLAVKDLFATAGIRTTAHSKVLADWVPQEDATVVARLKEAGAVLLGKLSLHEFAFGGPTLSGYFPPARNPWNLDLIPGGSSSGSGAGVAAGLCMGALGSDTGGSIRSPASLCGIVGLKPTYGLVSRHGVIPLSWSLDHVGPMTWNVEDTALMLQAIAGHDPKDPASSPTPVPDYRQALVPNVQGMRLGVPRRFFYTAEDLDPEVGEAVEKAIAVLEGLGATVQKVDIPHIEEAGAAGTIILLSEAYAYHEPELKARPQDFGPNVRQRFRMGALFLASDYLRAQRMRSILQEEFAAALKGWDALIAPTSPKPATRFEDYTPQSTLTAVSFTRPFNLVGLPTISVPCGFTRAGLPIGMQIAGRPFAETTVLRLAYTYEQQTPWHQRRPPL